LWVKLHTKLLNWEWYSDINTTRLFIHLLLKANWKDSRYRGYEVSRGSLVTGRKKLAKETGLTEQQIRTSLNKLKSTNEITIKTTKNFSIISIVNYEMYQQNNQEDNQQATNKQPTSNHITEYKNIEYIDIYYYLEQQFGRTLASVEYELLVKWQGWFTDDIIKLAIDITMKNGARAISYTEKIINTWHDKGYTTLEQCQNEGQTPKHEQEPVKEVFDYDWLNEKEEK